MLKLSKTSFMTSSSVMLKDFKKTCLKENSLKDKFKKILKRKDKKREQDLISLKIYKKSKNVQTRSKCDS